MSKDFFTMKGYQLKERKREKKDGNDCDGHLSTAM